MKTAIFGAGTNGLLFSKGMSDTEKVIDAFLDQSKVSPNRWTENR